jgi:hypothetical protein
MDLIPLLLSHPDEFWTILRFTFSGRRKRDITLKEEHSTSGWDRASMRRCWYFLDVTGRSIAPFIREFAGDLARVVSFALVFISEFTFMLTPMNNSRSASSTWCYAPWIPSKTT